MRDTVPRLETLGPGSAQAYNVMATATNYLPDAIGGYVRLPRQWADSRPVDRGKTSLMVLIDQLDLLGATMDKVFDAVCREDAQALVVHGRFLEEKFGGAAGGGDLRLGSTPLPPLPATPPDGAAPNAGAVSPLTPPDGRRRRMTPLTEALDALAAVARDLGVEPHVARREGVDLSATVLEPVQGAVSLTWAQATGSDTTGDRAAANVAFSNAASEARRWRAAPTDVVSHLTLTGAPAGRYADALVSVLSATAALGSGNARVADNVARAAASQRAGDRPGAGSPGVRPRSSARSPTPASRSRCGCCSPSAPGRSGAPSTPRARSRAAAAPHAVHRAHRRRTAGRHRLRGRRPGRLRRCVSDPGRRPSLRRRPSRRRPSRSCSPTSTR